MAAQLLSQVYDDQRSANGFTHSISKRLKTSFNPDLTKFTKGGIVRVKLVNFMSYQLSEFHFGPAMNLIIGPNGSGKSTFVCAVCIGLAGKLDYLGKANMNIDQFIKTGEHRAVIELEFKGSGNGSFVIKRELIRNAKSNWFLDDRSANESVIKRTLKEYNIQLDNLCQFLPQDRVSRFASLKPEELLKEIERSYQDGELFRQHDEAIGLYNDRAEKQKNLTELKDKLTTLKTQNESLQEQVNLMKEYKRLEKELEMHKGIKPYIEYQSYKSQALQLKEERTQKENEIRKFEKSIEPLNDFAQNATSNTKDADEEIKQALSIQARAKHKIEILFRDLDKIDEDIMKLQDNKLSLETGLDGRKKTLKRYLTDEKEALENLERYQSAQPEDVEALREEKAKLAEERIQLREPLDNAKEELATVQAYQNQLNRTIKDSQDRLHSTDKLKILDHRRFGDLIRAVKLLRRKKHEGLRLTYYEPAIISLNPTDQRYAAILESAIRVGDQLAFTVPDKINYDILSRILYDEHRDIGRGVGIRTLGNNSSRNDTAPVSLIKSLGFDGYLSDFLEGDTAVIQMIVENNDLHRVPVSLKPLNNSQHDEISRRVKSNTLRITKYFVQDTNFTFNQSKFGSRQVTTNIRRIDSNAKNFVKGLSQDQKTQIINDMNRAGERLNGLQDQFDQAQEKVEITRRALDEVTAKLKEIQSRIDKEKTLTQRIQKATILLETVQSRIRNEKRYIIKLKKQSSPEAIIKIFEEIEKLQIDRIKNLEHIEREYSIVSEAIEKENLNKVFQIQEFNKLESINQLHQSINDKRNFLMEERQDILANYKQAKKQASILINEYKNYLNGLNEEDNNLQRKLESTLKNEGRYNVDALGAEIDRIKKKMKLAENSNNQRAMETLEKNEAEVNKLETKIPKEEELINELNENIDILVNDWKPKLEQIISVISKDFGVNLSKVASAGDVKLDCNSPNFAEWKLRILVSFRDNEELTQLNAAQQSGGEKSATTAVFLNSLQGLTNTPFRIVDEINQGMDSNNERLVHKLIVDKACSSTESSQYFLITPKLLTGLHYIEGMTVHCILAGRLGPDPEDKFEFLELGITNKFVR